MNGHQPARRLSRRVRRTGAPGLFQKTTPTTARLFVASEPEDSLLPRPWHAMRRRSVSYLKSTPATEHDATGSVGDFVRGTPGIVALVTTRVLPGSSIGVDRALRRPLTLHARVASLLEPQKAVIEIKTARPWSPFAYLRWVCSNAQFARQESADRRSAGSRCTGSTHIRST